MTNQEKREVSRQFCNKWNGKGREDEDDRSYWLDILSQIMEINRATDYVEFQKKVIVDGNTKKIDVYIPTTRVLIEQKSLGINLNQKIHQSDGLDLTPYEQAKRYNDNLPFDEKARWIVTSNFAEIWIYDMNARVPEPVKLSIIDLQSKYSELDFLVVPETKKISHEEEISIQAGDLVGKIYDALLKQYEHPEDPEVLKSLNKICVRIVFCLYAEDSGIFGRRNLFHDYLSRYDAQHARRALVELFKVLDQKPEERERYLADDDPLLASFPYVNGGLFKEENIEIPPFTDEVLNIILNKASTGFDWSQISPTIFGAVFESTLNPETRRSGGMHYTSIENIHKVIDPLFLNDLESEFNEICGINVWATKKKKLAAFQDKLSKLVFLDPAAGSGNFLTETYLCLRRIENKALSELQRGQIEFGFENMNPIKVSISQFYGIEINDFAVTVAMTALWIAESQMMQETEDIIHMSLDFLPLKTNANIVEGNALRMDWEDVISKDKISYIMGNPPFVGYGLQSPEQKADILSIYKDEKGKPYKTAGKIDYVAGWYFKLSQLIQGTNIRAALVSTNSITQGEQVASVWEPLFKRFNIHIDFAYKTFIWDSEASIKAHVHCVIIGLSTAYSSKKRFIIEGENKTTAQNINAYLMDGEDIFIPSRTKPICCVKQMTTGNRPADGGNLIIEDEDYEEFISKEPNAIKYIKRLTGSEEYINDRKRYCLWLVDADVTEIRKMPEVMKRIEACREDRLSGAADRQKLADRPMLFRETINPDQFIIVPRVSSEKRRYIPIGFLDKKVIPTDSATIIVDADLYDFGVLISNVHMSWMRTICGRLKSDYRYSKDIVYNNFPWPNPTDDQKEKIMQTAQKILDARKLYTGSSLAELYGENMYLYEELVKAHINNDKAVMQAYGFSIRDMSEDKCVSELMKMYKELSDGTND